jgi:hypothetical protein
MLAPAEILAIALERANTNVADSIVKNEGVRQRIELICRNIRNKALSRLILSCCLAKIHKPEVDIRKPYTEIGGRDTFSGRTYDEAYIGQFIAEHRLPCNTTTAFLTPALRNRSETLTPSTNLVGRPPELYKAALQLLDDVHTGTVSADDLLAESIRSMSEPKLEDCDRSKQSESIENMPPNPKHSGRDSAIGDLPTRTLRILPFRHPSEELPCTHNG